MASGVPYATWDGGEYVVRVDLEPDHARTLSRLLGIDGAAQGYWDAAERVDHLRDPDHDPRSCEVCNARS